MKKLCIVLFLFSFFSERSAAQCTGTVPYYEGFQGITVTNQLPPCWIVSNATTCGTSTVGGVNVGTMFYAPGGTNYFFTNGVQLYAGVTYSMSSWYYVTNNNAATWLDYSMLIGPNQSPVGQFTVASTNGPVFNMQAAPLSNTFVVSSSGVYYASVRATSNGVVGSMFLIWDDLAITAPCTLANNSPSVTVAAPATTLCAGSQLSLTASGADTYTWNNSSTAPGFTFSAQANITHIVAGTYTLSGCTSTAQTSFTVYPLPPVSLMANWGNNTICSGGSANLVALAPAASSFYWNTGQQGSTIAVAPMVNTGYTVTATSAQGCSASDALTITVLPTPTISLNSPSVICQGETATLSINAISMSGNTTCQWQWGQGSSVFNSFTLQPLANMIVTVSVMDIALPNCVAKTQFMLEVNACTGLDKEQAGAYSSRVYPNPSAGLFHLESADQERKTVEVTDLSGRSLFLVTFDGGSGELDLCHLPAGVYALSIFSTGPVQHLKLIKH